MGNSTSNLVYSVECSEKKEGETTIRRAPGCENGLKNVPDEHTNTI